MKAKEYFQKYDKPIWEEAHDPAIHTDGPTAKLYIDFALEMKEIMKVRNVQFDRGVFSIIREQNDKWNAIRSMFIKKYGVSPISHDGFATAIKKDLGIPEK